MTMIRLDLIGEISERTCLTKNASDTFLTAMVDVITDKLTKKRKYRLYDQCGS
ncbi:HU family DNA-binding protein [Sinanaerobacter chloroacetimidivorans]|uniref:HU family DNA-binding protein n=1 Tax=Sinanaerobacter chloroacetimidivorans TaxID=2818044 RepID=A0A8J7W4K5_9FIRM|nr:HU family DNA-binding protein [Sinanaerobacter chloroacetimidivorans]MBR0599248.1 HU family DNA-binding protein [Sinanaerobacter chloroacetimidivorans]